MTLFQVEELTSYWTQHPPLHRLIAAYIGTGKEKPARPPPVSPIRARQANSDIGEMLTQLGPGFSAGEVHAGLSPVVLDFAELRRRATVPR